MKRALSVVLGLAALVISLVPAAFASEAELSDIQRPVDAAITQYPAYQQVPNVGGPAGSASVTNEQIIVEPLRFEGL